MFPLRLALTRSAAFSISAPPEISRQIERRTEVNKARRSRVRTFLRKFEDALTGGDLAAARAAFVEAQSELMRAVSKGVVHKNTGARKVSRLAAQLKKAGVA
jgi:small subunit ribosomal protein S20